MYNIQLSDTALIAFEKVKDDLADAIRLFWSRRLSFTNSWCFNICICNSHTLTLHWWLVEIIWCGNEIQNIRTRIATNLRFLHHLLEERIFHILIEHKPLIIAKKEKYEKYDNYKYQFSYIICGVSIIC